MPSVAPSQYDGHGDDEDDVDDENNRDNNDRKNAAALGKAIAAMTSVPWTLCVLILGLAHWTYPKERKNPAAPQGLFEGGAVATDPRVSSPLVPSAASSRAAPGVVAEVELAGSKERTAASQEEGGGVYQSVTSNPLVLLGDGDGASLGSF